MSIEATDILARLVTNEFVAIVDLFQAIANLAGIVCFVLFCYEYLNWQKMKAQMGMGQRQGSLGRAVGLIFASAFLWRFGEGAALFGNLLFGLDTATPYSSAVYESVVRDATQVARMQFQSGGANTVFNHYAVQAGFAVFNLYGNYSYLRGCLGLAQLGGPGGGQRMTPRIIVTHLIFGVALMYIDDLFSVASNTASAASGLT